MEREREQKKGAGYAGSSTFIYKYLRKIVRPAWRCQLQRLLTLLGPHTAHVRCAQVSPMAVRGRAEGWKEDLITFFQHTSMMHVHIHQNHPTKGTALLPLSWKDSRTLPMPSLFTWLGWSVQTLQNLSSRLLGRCHGRLKSPDTTKHGAYSVLAKRKLDLHKLGNICIIHNIYIILYYIILYYIILYYIIYMYISYISIIYIYIIYI